MNILNILILSIAWVTPLVVFLLYKRNHPSQNIFKIIGSFLILLSLIVLMFWPEVISQESSASLRGLSGILIYPVWIGYALIGVRSIIRLKNGKSQTYSWSHFILFLLAGILGVILGNYLSIILISWLLIVITLYRLITYKDIDLAARQDYRERFKKDYLDRF